MKKVLSPVLMMMVGFQAVSASADVNGVIGKDERVQITSQNNQILHRSIGLLEIRFGQDYYTCTGTVVGPKHVITAAHCLYEDGKMPDEVVFYPAVKSDPEKVSPPLGKFTASVAEILKNYTILPTDLYDVGMIEFKQILPVKPLPLAMPSYNLTKSHTLSVAGYPGDKNYGTMWESKAVLSSTWNPSLNQHKLDTVAGMSGSSMRMGANVVGIHSAGRRDESGKYVMNYSHFFTAESLAAVKSWIAH